jgi:EAL domain-containing protein (putative c-di-GMP-specific phosphodiesterase class I)
LVAQSLAVWSVPAASVTLELTESIPMGNADKALPMLRRLKEVGVRLAIDDFGTGYSSLSLLRQLPVDELKIDQQFVRGMLQSEGSMQIVRAVLDLAGNFGLKTVAEGIEDERTLDALRDLGCTIGQGYAIGRPMPDTALIDWFRAR